MCTREWVPVFLPRDASSDSTRRDSVHVQGRSSKITSLRPSAANATPSSIRHASPIPGRSKRLFEHHTSLIWGRTANRPTSSNSGSSLERTSILSSPRTRSRPTRQSIRFRERLREVILPSAEGALRREVMRLFERFRDWSEEREDREDGMALRRLNDRSRDVRRDRGRVGKERRVVEWSER